MLPQDQQAQQRQAERERRRRARQLEREDRIRQDQIRRFREREAEERERNVRQRLDDNPQGGFDENTMGDMINAFAQGLAEGGRGNNQQDDGTDNAIEDQQRWALTM